MTKEQRHKYPLDLIFNEVKEHYKKSNSINTQKFIKQLEEKYGNNLEEWYNDSKNGVTKNAFKRYGYGNQQNIEEQKTFANREKNPIINVSYDDGRTATGYLEDFKRKSKLHEGSSDSTYKELDNSSFSLKEKQLEIIQNSNPVADDYHTWIRSVDDIKTLEETLQDSDRADYDELPEKVQKKYSKNK